MSVFSIANRLPTYAELERTKNRAGQNAPLSNENSVQAAATNSDGAVSMSEALGQANTFLSRVDRLIKDLPSAHQRELRSCFNDLHRCFAETSAKLHQASYSRVSDPFGAANAFDDAVKSVGTLTEKVDMMKKKIHDGFSKSEGDTAVKILGYLAAILTVASFALLALSCTGVLAPVALPLSLLLYGSAAGIGMISGGIGVTLAGIHLKKCERDQENLQKVSFGLNINTDDKTRINASVVGTESMLEDVKDCLRELENSAVKIAAPRAEIASTDQTKQFGSPAIETYDGSKDLSGAASETDLDSLQKGSGEGIPSAEDISELMECVRYSDAPSLEKSIRPLEAHEKTTKKLVQNARNFAITFNKCISNVKNERPEKFRIFSEQLLQLFDNKDHGYVKGKHFNNIAYIIGDLQKDKSYKRRVLFQISQGRSNIAVEIQSGHENAIKVTRRKKVFQALGEFTPKPITRKLGLVSSRIIMFADKPRGLLKIIPPLSVKQVGFATTFLKDKFGKDIPDNWYHNHHYSSVIARTKFRNFADLAEKLCFSKYDPAMYNIELKKRLDAFIGGTEDALDKANLTSDQRAACLAKVKLQKIGHTTIGDLLFWQHAHEVVDRVGEIGA